jgi:hypothetical protein
MRTQTRAQIIEFIIKNDHARPHDLAAAVGVKAAALHRHLKALVADGTLRKVGNPPRVFYVLSESALKPTSSHYVPTTTELARLKSSYLYIDPSGNMLLGWDGFSAWLKSIGEEKRAKNLIAEYEQVRDSAERFRTNQVIDATERLHAIFKDAALERVFYGDFYSLPKFGKTKLGNLVLHGKQAQDENLITQVADFCRPLLIDLIQHYNIDAIAWAPHSLPRKIPFLKVMEKRLALSLPRIDLVKAFSGEIPIAQKTLAKLEERIRNAADTIFVRAQGIPYANVLLIDDAVGSGATLEQCAKKLKSAGAKHVFGFAVVGSYKGFEVIREI